jgi:hypothetical protein
MAWLGQPNTDVLFRYIFSIAAFLLDLYAFITLVGLRPAPQNGAFILWTDVTLMVIVILQYAMGIDRAGFLGYAYYMSCSALSIWACNHYVQAYDVGILLKVTFIPFHFLILVHLSITSTPAAVAKTEPLRAIAEAIFPHK